MKVWRWPASLNRLLVYWALTGLPAAIILSWPLEQPGPGLVACVATWAAWRLLNRRVWKQHFRPRATR